MAETTVTPGTEVSPKEVEAQAIRRRTFAVISHPDAGKSTLTRSEERRVGKECPV